MFHPILALCSAAERYGHNVMKWKLISRLFLMSVLLVTLGYSAAALESDFVIVDGTLIEYHGEGGNVVIPEGVIHISASAFDQNDRITSVVVPQGVLSISGFDSCKNLSSITLPDGLLEIRTGAFNHCTQLTRIEIPDSVLFFDKSFWDCTNLAYVRLPQYAAVEDRAFQETPWGSTNIIGVQPPWPTVMATYVRTGTYTRTKPSEATRQGEFMVLDGVVTAYHGAGGAVVLPEGITAIGPEVFKGNTSITSLTVPESLRVIGIHAFEGCTELKSISRFPNQLQRIGHYAFFDCTALSSIDLPAKTLTESSAFSGSPYDSSNGLAHMVEDAFRVLRKYTGQCSDVNTKSWFYPYLVKAYEAGVMGEKTDGKFHANDTLSAAEAIQIVAKIHASATGQLAQLQTNEPGVQVYYDYMDRYSTLEMADWQETERPIRRNEFAALIYYALPFNEWYHFGIDLKLVPDMRETRSDGATYGLPYSDEVDTLYTVGVCVLYEDGKFHPERNITRAEAVVIAARAIDPALRA